MIKKIFAISFSIVFIFGLCTLVQASEVTGTINPGLTTGMEGVIISAPIASPAADTYTSSQSISLTASGSTAICYTIDSTTPACSSSTTCSTGSVYSSAISVTSTTTIKSIACYADGSSGPSSSDAYTISSDDSPGGGGGSGYVPPSSDTTTLSGESVTINYAEEGTLTKTFTDNSEIVIEIPICTVESETTFDVEQKVLVNYETPLATVGAILVGNMVFEITATDAENVAVTSFYRAITITITIPDLPQDISDLGLYYYNHGTDSWGLIPNAQFDPTTGEVTFTTDHFTKFAVFNITGTPYFLSVDLSLKGVGTIAENALVKTSESPAVYLIESGKRKPIKSAEIFLAKGYKWGDILVVSQAEMDNYALGTEVTIEEDSVEEFVGTLSDGMLVRKQGTYGVYLIHNNTKRPIKSAEVFLGRGYKWGDVVDVEQSALDVYALGEDVAIAEAITTALQTITINTPRLRVRSLPGLEGEIITLVLTGQVYSILAEQNDWYQINYESGKTGWVMGIYTVLSDSSTAISSIKINTPKLRVRSLPGLEGEIITLVSEGQEYSVLTEQNGWYQINYESGKTGWVMGAYVVKQ